MDAAVSSLNELRIGLLCLSSMFLVTSWGFPYIGSGRTKSVVHPTILKPMHGLSVTTRSNSQHRKLCHPVIQIRRRAYSEKTFNGAWHRSLNMAKGGGGPFWRIQGYTQATKLSLLGHEEPIPSKKMFSGFGRSKWLPEPSTFQPDVQSIRCVYRKIINPKL